MMVVSAAAAAPAASSLPRARRSNGAHPLMHFAFSHLCLLLCMVGGLLLLATAACAAPFPLRSSAAKSLLLLSRGGEHQGQDSTTRESSRRSTRRPHQNEDAIAEAPVSLPTWLSDYVRFHNAPSSNTTRYLVYSCPHVGTCGGIGDRMKGMAGVLLWAVATRRKLLIEGYEWPGCPNPYIPNLLNWIQPSVYMPSLDFAPPGPLVDLNLSDEQFLSAIDPVSELMRWIVGRPDRVLIAQLHSLSLQSVWSTVEFRAVTGVGGPNSVNVDPRIATALLEVLFQRSHALNVEVARLRGVADLGSAGAPFLALHLRTLVGPGVPFKEVQVKISPLNTSAILACARSIAATLEMPIYIASDDSLLKSALRSANPLIFRVGVPVVTHLNHYTGNCQLDLATFAEFELLRSSRVFITQTADATDQAVSGFAAMSILGSPNWAAGRQCFLNWAWLDESLRRRPEHCADDARSLQEECHRFRRPCDEATTCPFVND